ncbi:MAG: ABC transporter substrate-binding protein [Burkholderiales bacterium]|nr:ABC transporter substrate-binding protein [Burkholderiales bacterium]
MMAGAGAAQAQARGVTDKEIRIGTLLDLSGALASAGKDARDGMQMRVDEINAQGGINGRQLRLLVEDHGYDPKKAVLGAQKLIDRDGIFAVVGQLGTATMMASAPLLRQKDTVNFMPLTATALTYEPPQPLMFAYLPSYVDQLSKAMPPFLKQVNARKVCVIYQDDEFGQEILRGAEAGLKAAGLPVVERTSYKRGATDFSSQVARTAAAGCDAVVLGTVIRETVGVMTEARKIGYKPAFVSTVSAYSATVPKLGGDNVEGLYATVVLDQPYADSGPAESRAWSQRYKAAFKEDPSVFSAQGYFVVESFANAARAAGPQLTTASLVKALETTRLPATLFGTPEVSYSPTKRIGIDTIRLARIKDGRWIAAE